MFYVSTICIRIEFLFNNRGKSSDIVEIIMICCSLMYIDQLKIGHDYIIADVSPSF